MQGHCLWRKPRPKPTQPPTPLPLSPLLETVSHAISSCKFYLLAANIVLKAFGPLWGATGVLREMQTLLVKEPLFSLKTTQGLALLAAARAAWVLKM